MCSTQLVRYLHLKYQPQVLQAQQTRWQPSYLVTSEIAMSVSRVCGTIPHDALTPSSLGLGILARKQISYSGRSEGSTAPQRADRAGCRLSTERVQHRHCVDPCKLSPDRSSWVQLSSDV